MRSGIAFAAALALCGSAFAASAPQHGFVASAKQEAHQIGSSLRQDLHRIARADKFRQQQAADQHRAASHARAMGAGPGDSGRQARMDAAYANWQRTHR